MSSNQSEFKCVDRGKFEVTGDLTFISVTPIWNQARKVLRGIEEENLDIDIGSTKELDSGGLALLVAWSRWAHCNNKKIIFRNASEQARKLVEINKLNDILNLA